MRRTLSIVVAAAALAGSALAQDVPPVAPPARPSDAPPANVPPATPERGASADGAPAGGASDLPRLLAALRDAAPDAVPAAIDAVLRAAPAAESLGEVLLAGLPSATATAGWSVLSARDAAGIERPYHLYVPRRVAEASKAAPMIVDMHGGVGREAFITEEQFTRFRDTWTEAADSEGFVVAMPLGRADCMWWKAAGVAHVRATIRDAMRHAPVDADRIVGTGFSDGGSACWYLTMAAPDPFAAFLPMNGHPEVASGASGDQIYPENTVTTPLFVAMTQDDGLYPAVSVMPHVQALLDLKAQLHVVSYPTGGHSPSYFEDQKTVFVKFALAARRDASPDSVEWRTATPELGRFRWIAIDETGESAGDAAAAPDVQVASRPGRVTLGFRIDQKHAGAGVRVEGVMPDTTASRMALAAGDVIVSIDGKPVADVRTLRRALDAKAHGDAIEVSVERGGAVVALQGKLDPFRASPAYRRDKPTARIAAVRDGNVVTVTSRNVRRFRVLVGPGDFDLSKDVEVLVNGVSRFRGPVTPGAKAMLTRFAADGDSARPVLAEIAVSLPAPEPAPR